MKLFQTVKKYLYFLAILLIVAAFFYKSILFGQIPFPGDLLVGNYEPYKSLAYDGYVPGSVPHKGQGPDVIKELIPWKKFIVESFKSGQIPFWNPYNFSGNPQLANFQSAPFFPVNIIFFVLNFTAAWALYIMLIPFLAACFTYLFLRRIKLPNEASIFGGIIFAFSSYMTVWMEYGNIGYTFVFLPLVLYFADCLLEKISIRNFLGIVVSSLLALIAGYIQGVFYIYAIVIFYFLFKFLSDKKRNIYQGVIFGFGLFIPILLSAFQLLPTLVLFGQSSRGNYTLDQIQAMLNPVYYLITIAVPDFFGNPATRNYWLDGTYIERVSYFGLIPLVAALYAIVSNFKRVEVKIFTVLFVIPLILATDLFITRYFYLIPIPVLSTTVATRILSISTFAGCVLASIGFALLVEKKNLKQLLFVSFAVFAFLIILFVRTKVFIALDPDTIKNFSVAWRNLIIPIGSLILFFILVASLWKFKKYNKTFLVLAIFIISFADLFYYFQKITPFAPGRYMYPSTPVVEYLKKQQKTDRSWGYGLADIEANFQTYENIYSTEGNDPLHIRQYTELLAASANGRLPAILPRPDANIAPGFGVEELANNPYRQKALNITGVKYVLNKNDALSGDYNPDYTTFPEDTYKLIWQEKPWQVYENKKAVPRIYITDKYGIVPVKKTLNKIYNSNLDDNIILLNEDPKIKQGNLSAKSELVLYTQNKVIIKSSTSKDALLYLSDTYYPEWEATIDGSNAKIYLANYAFRAVAVPAGRHIITFEYQPKSFYRGLYIGILGLISLVVVCVYIKRGMTSQYEN